MGSSAYDRIFAMANVGATVSISVEGISIIWDWSDTLISGKQEIRFSGIPKIRLAEVYIFYLSSHRGFKVK